MPDHVFIYTPTLELDDSWIEIVEHLEKRSTEKHPFKKSQ